MASANAAQSPSKAPVISDAELNKKWDDLVNYQVIRKSKDPRFGDIIILKHKTKKELIFAKEKWVNSKDKAAADIADMKEREKLNHSEVQKFLGYSTAVDKQLCSTNYLIIGYYAFPKSDLYKELQDKLQNGQNFSAEDLTLITNEALSGLHFLHDQQKIHGDIRPLHIGYDKDERQAELLDRLNDPSPEDRAQLNNLNNKKDLYVSPELWAKLKGKKGFDYQKDKNDYYALGLSILHAGIGRSIQDIYKADGSVDQAVLSGHIGEFNARYKAQSPYLSIAVQSLLAEDERVRGDAIVSKVNNKDRIRVQNVPSEVVVSSTPTVTYQTYNQSWAAPEVSQAVDGKQVTVVRPDGTSYTYIQRNNVSNNVIYNYDQNKLVYVQPFNPAPNVQYVQAPITQSYSQLYPDTRPSLVTVQRSISPNVADSRIAAPQVVSTSVEVRRGSSIPYTSDQKAVLKRYIVQDDKLIEINVNDAEAAKLEEQRKADEAKKAEEQKKAEEEAAAHKDESAPAEHHEPAPEQSEPKHSEPAPEPLKEEAV